MITIDDIIKATAGQRFNLENEKILQAQLAAVFPWAIREHRLDEKNIPDFYVPAEGIAIEVKIKGSRFAIYKQCERYAAFDQVHAVVLITNRAIGFPKDFYDEVPCYVINLSKAWL